MADRGAIGPNPVFRSIEGRAHGVLGLSAVDRTVVVCIAGIASMASPVLGGLIGAVVVSALLGLRRISDERRDHLAIRGRRLFGRRRYDPARPDERWDVPPR